MRSLDHLQKLYKLCTHELAQLQENLGKFVVSSDEVLDVIADHWQEINDGNSSAVPLLAYDHFLTTISNMTDMSRKFNLHLHINNLDNNSTTSPIKALQAYHLKRRPPVGVQTKRGDAATQTLDDTATKQPSTNGVQAPTQVRQNGYDNSQYSIPSVDDDDNSSSEEHENTERSFRYVKKDLSHYQAGCILNASTTYIENLATLRFFVWDLNSPHLSKVHQMSDMLHLRQYTERPKQNEVFGLVQENMVLRAVRECTSKVEHDAKDCFRALLLDFGEVVEASIANVMYRLPVEYQKTPAQAIPCQLRSVNGRNRDSENLRAILQRQQFERAVFCVEERVGGVLQLQLIDLEIDEPKPHKIADSNPFKDSLLAAEAEKQKISKSLEEAVPLSALPHALNSNNRNTLTPEELEILYEEPLCTSNAMKAVMGYDPQDDKRICRFFNPKTRSCFKGSNCRQEHTLLQPEGWTKDVLPSATIIDNRMPAIRYASKSIINITPTYVGQPDQFYIQINDPKKPIAPFIWNPEDVPDWKRLQKPPLIFELVMAKYDDNLWYRAKVIDIDEVGKMIAIFYVDYGNHKTVGLRDLAQCDYATAQLPFQAILCRIAGVRDSGATLELRKRGVDLLCKTILNQTFDVKVINHHEDLLVQFLHKPFNQLPSTLIEMGCLKPFKSVAT